MSTSTTVHVDPLDEDKRAHPVHPGDVLYIPAGAPHSYRVIEAPFEFLCMVPNAPDKLEILDPSC